MKKILFVGNDYTYFLSHRLPIAEACLDRGWEVHIITPEQDKAAKNARKYRMFWHGIPMDPGSQNPFKEIKTCWVLKELYSTLKPDLVYHVTLKPVLLGSVAAKIAKVPAEVNALTGLGYLYINDNLKNSLIRPVVNHLFQFGFSHSNSCLILQNKDDKAMVLDYNLLKEKDIEIVRGSGVNTDKYPYVTEENAQIRVILPGRMLWDKGVGEFIKAAKKLRSEGCDATFHLFGDADPKNPKSISRSQLEKWNQEDGIFYEGYQENMQIAYKEANVVCLPSYREGLPKALLEAASTGRAIITTDAPGCREVVREGENGYLVPVKNVDKMAKRIKELIDEPELRRKFGKKSREIAVNNFSIEQVVSDIMNLFESLLNNTAY